VQRTVATMNSEHTSAELNCAGAPGAATATATPATNALCSTSFTMRMRFAPQAVTLLSAYKPVVYRPLTLTVAVLDNKSVEHLTPAAMFCVSDCM